MHGNENTLQQPLLDEQQVPAAPNDIVSRLIIRPEGSDIVFSIRDAKSPDSPNVPIPPSLLAQAFFYSTLSFVMVTKCVASSGMMVFSERDLLENEHYIFWEVLFKHLPNFAVETIIICTVFSDTFMNLVTRGSATAKMLRTVLYGHSDESTVHILSGSCCFRFSKGLIMFCGGLSSVTASLVAFLGAVTLGHYVTDNLFALMAWGSLVASANFVVNISYRIDKSVDNFVKVINGEVKFTPGLLLISAIGSAAFLGTCYYGTANSIRKLLNLLKVYAGEPESGVGVILSYEHWINGATDMTLPFAIISYFFASCVPMFESSTALADTDFRVPLKHVVRYVGTLKTTNHYRKYLYLEALQLFCVTLMPFFVISTMLGTILPTFNSSNGLIIHLFYGSRHDFSHMQKLIVMALSLLLTVVFSKIFWNFNVVDWFSKVEELWVREALRVMQHEQPFAVQGDDVIQQLQKAIVAANPSEETTEVTARPGLWGSWRSRVTPTRWQAGYEQVRGLEEGPSSAQSAPLLPI